MKQIKAQLVTEDSKATNQGIFLQCVLDKKDLLLGDKMIAGYHDELNEEDELIRYPFYSSFVNNRVVLDYGGVFQSDEGDCKGESIRTPKGCRWHEILIPKVAIKKSVVLEMLCGDEKLQFQITNITDAF